MLKCTLRLYVELMCMNGMKSRNTTIVSLIFNSCHRQKCGKSNCNSSCQLNWGIDRFCVASDQIERENFKIQYVWSWQTNKGLFYLYAFVWRSLCEPTYEWISIGCLYGIIGDIHMYKNTSHIIHFIWQISFNIFTTQSASVLKKVSKSAIYELVHARVHFLCGWMD